MIIAEIIHTNHRELPFFAINVRPYPFPALRQDENSLLEPGRLSIFGFFLTPVYS
jgi:hypothetical protein